MANRNRTIEPVDILVGGADDDFLSGSGGSDGIEGGSGDDTLAGGGGRDHVLGGSGNDRVYGGDSRDIVRGGSGNDFIDGGRDDDFLTGDSGDDHIKGDDGWDRLYGGNGADFLEGGSGDDVLVGGAGDDILIGGAGNDHFLYRSTSGDDIIYQFERNSDVVDLRLLPEAIAFRDLTIVDLEDDCGAVISHPALDGTITIMGTAASDLSASNFAMPDGETTSVQIGGAWFTAPNFSFSGTDGNQLILNHEIDSQVDARGGRDRVFGGEGNDRIYGGYSADTLYGEEGDDILEGGYGPDQLFGGEGNDRLTGGAFDDGFQDNAYHDVLVGGEGNDVLTGDSGDDRFVFGRDHGNDMITDFGDGADVIDLTGLERISGFDDLLIWEVGTAAVVDLRDYGGGTILLEHTAVGDLDAADFVFYEPRVDGAAIDSM